MPTYKGVVCTHSAQNSFIGDPSLSAFGPVFVVVVLYSPNQTLTHLGELRNTCNLPSWDAVLPFMVKSFLTRPLYIFLLYMYALFGVCDLF